MKTNHRHTIALKSQPSRKLVLYIGLLDQNGNQRSLEELENCLGFLVKRIGLCVSVSKISYVYGSSSGVCGRETGAAITFINYPRFPSTKAELWAKATTVARKLLLHFDQKRCTVVGDEETKMLSNKSALTKA